MTVFDCPVHLVKIDNVNLVVPISHCAKCNRVKIRCEQYLIITLVAFFRKACAFHHWLNDLYRLGLQWLQQNIHRWRLVKLFVNYFDCLLRVEICLRVFSLAFAVLFHSVCVCVCVFLCHQLVSNSADLNHLFYSIY